MGVGGAWEKSQGGVEDSVLLAKIRIVIGIFLYSCKQPESERGSFSASTLPES